MIGCDYIFDENCSKRNYLKRPLKLHGLSDDDKDVDEDDLSEQEKLNLEAD